MTTQILRRHCAVLAILLSSLSAGCSDDADEERGPPRVANTVDEDPKISALELSSTRVHVREKGADHNSLTMRDAKQVIPLLVDYFALPR